MVKIYECELDITFLGLETRQASLITGDPFLRTFVPSHKDDGVLLFISDFTIAVITKGPNFYLFDSHSCDHRGLSVPDGTFGTFPDGTIVTIYRSFWNRKILSGCISRV